MFEITWYMTKIMITLHMCVYCYKQQNLEPLLVSTTILKLMLEDSGTKTN